MNTNLKGRLTAGLKALYEENDAARRLFDNFASRTKDWRETTASHAAWLANAHPSEITALFRKLDELGAGQFKVGRRGSKSRFVWAYSIRSLGAAARGHVVTPEDIDPDKVEDPETDASYDEAELEMGESEWIAHTFQLRPDLRLTIKLPADLTTREAERLAGFIHQVPFHDDE